MASLTSWLHRSLATTPKSPPVGPTGPEAPSPDADAASSAIQDAMDAAAMALNDDLDGAEAVLKQAAAAAATPFHQLALGATLFVRTILTLDKAVMAEAAGALAAAETRALDDMKRAQRDARGRRWLKRALRRKGGAGAGGGSGMYPPGSEFAMVHAQAQLMGTVVAVVRNPKDMKSAVRGLYRLRKAVKMLERIAAAEERMVRRHLKVESWKALLSDEDDDEFEVVEAGEEEEEEEDGEGLPELENGDAADEDGSEGDDWIPVGDDDAAMPTDEAIEKLVAELKVDAPKDTASPSLPARGTFLEADPSLFANPVDRFIHSSANMCFGMLLLIRALIPPQFSGLLNILGFRDDRERGLRMLWQSSKFADVNINGAVSGLILLSYYNEMRIWADIMPSAADVEQLGGPGEMAGFPKNRCLELLQRMNKEYPQSRIIQMEQGRQLGSNGELEEAIKVFGADGNSKIQAVTALTKFEQAVHAMTSLDWELTRKTFLRHAELEHRSRGLDWYFAGCAAIEQYRDAIASAKRLEGDEGRAADRVKHEAAAKRYKAIAQDLFEGAEAEKSNFMPKRNIGRWMDRAEDTGIDLADAVGVSPAIEMLYLWHGPRRMDSTRLAKAVECLDWERCTAPKDVMEEMKGDPIECAIVGVSKASLLHCLEDFAQARKVLDEVLKYDREIFKLTTKEEYLLPAATYEAAIVSWKECCQPAGGLADAKATDSHRRSKANECLAHLQKIADWEPFVLETHMRMRVRSGMEAVNWLKKKKKWVEK